MPDYHKKKFGEAVNTLCLCIALLVAGCNGATVRTPADVPTAIAGQRPEASSSSLPACTPGRIILNLTDSPATRQAVTWRTDAPVASPRVRIVAATGAADFDENPALRTVAAQTQPLTLDDGRVVYHHAAVLDDLAPDTLYAYRVGAEESWSEWSQFQTAGLGPAAFTFVYLGDPQEEIRSKCTRLFRAAYQKAPDADFWHFIGDLVDDGERDRQWSELFEALSWIPRTTPMILLPGNHEYPDKRFVHGADYRLTPLWRPHFTLPENGPAGLEETAYVIDYQGARLVMLNGNEMLEEQARWLDRILSVNPQRWTIAAIHQPMYSTGKFRDKTTLRDLFVPIFDRHRVDLVLQGHDHTYSRSAKLKNGVRAGANETGTVYAISVSGPKSYPVNPRYGDLMEKSGTGQQLFQVIRVSPERLTYQSFDAAGVLFDAFALEK